MIQLNLKEKYQKEVIPALEKEFAIKNKMAVPVLEKIVVNMGLGEAVKDKKVIEKVAPQLAAITGQKPSVRLAKTSIAGFGIRAGMPIGLSVTLRGQKMYDFLGRLTAVILPRLRDFRGLSKKSFDQRGNYTLGIAEHTVFPEINLESVEKARGLEITFVTRSKNKKQAQKLLTLLGMPFKKGKNG